VYSVRRIRITKVDEDRTKFWEVHAENAVFVAALHSSDIHIVGETDTALTRSKASFSASHVAVVHIDPKYNDI
jgi:hypothetical protein